jgi:hypothetical protein
MVCLSSYVKSQEKETVKEIGTNAKQPNPLADDWSKWLVGEWVVISGESSLADESGKESKIHLSDQGAGGFKIEFGLNGQFLIMNSRAETGEMTSDQIKYFKETLNYSEEEIERLKSNPFKELQIHTINPKTGERLGYLFDSMRCIATGIGRIEGNKEIMDWVWSGTAQGATSMHIMEKINDDKFTYYHKYTLPNGNIMEDKVVMTRIKSAEKRN